MYKFHCLQLDIFIFKKINAVDFSDLHDDQWPIHIKDLTFSNELWMLTWIFAFQMMSIFLIISNNYLFLNLITNKYFYLLIFKPKKYSNSQLKQFFKQLLWKNLKNLVQWKIGINWYSLGFSVVLYRRIPFISSFLWS